MTRSRLLVLMVLVTGFGIGWAVRGQRSAQAQEPTTVAMYGDNTEEVALDRWAHGAPRHWRALMVKR